MPSLSLQQRMLNLRGSLSETSTQDQAGLEDRILNLRQSLTQPETSQETSTQETSNLGSLARGLGTQLFDNLSNIPEALLNNTGLVMRARAAGADIPHIDLPNPLSSENIQAGAQLAGEGAAALTTGDFSNFTPPGEAVQQQIQQNTQAQADNPNFFAGGQLAGDALTLATGRAGLARGGIKDPRIIIRSAETNGANLISKAFKTVVKFGKESGKRAAFTGSELGALEELSGRGDTGTAAAAGAGAQVVGDVGRGALKKVFTTKTGLGVLLATVASSAAQQSLPGGFEIVEETFKEVTRGVGLTVLFAGAAALPTGRLPKSIAGPLVSEMADQISKPVLLRLIRAGMDNPDTVGPVAQVFAENPDTFGEKARKQLDRGFANGNPDVVIKRLLKNDKVFRNRFKELTSPRDN